MIEVIESRVDIVGYGVLEYIFSDVGNGITNNEEVGDDIVESLLTEQRMPLISTCCD
ncbi:13501_t:CDS:2 [Entrophospora sp. SA101]|nr:4348_t:CDS:2 [Entrophospora candida]CAG8519672.1 14733_t:CDS:2 [Entrophospora candida]CAJ0646030.1 13501_t:CDS:2 [Entrophospora sp. SA101]CAJ0872777.1 628_t:CDS:2 [Entrophospora sp. SA101]CAJ0877369.1 1180_t:CDS:2 [Entrophospora sp. SA101]